MTDSSSPSLPPSPLPFLPIVGAALLGGVVLGGGYWLADRRLDRQVEQRLEQGMTQLTGAPADCAQANARFFSPRIQIQDCKIENLAGFPSPHLLQVGVVELESRKLRQKPAEIDRLTLQNVTLNLDIKADLTPQNLLNPKALLPINLGEALAGLSTTPESGPDSDPDADRDSGSELNRETDRNSANPAASPDPANSSNPDPTNPNSPTDPQPRFIIQQLQIQNITATLTLQAPLFRPSRQFQLDNITLTEVTSENLEAKIFAALREEVSAEVQIMLGEEAAVVGQKALELLIPILRRSIEAYLLGLPF